MISDNGLMDSWQELDCFKRRQLRWPAPSIVERLRPTSAHFHTAPSLN
jgi:hypothetical protein